LLLRQPLSWHKTGRPGGSAHPLCSAHRPSRPTRCACGGLDLAYPRRNEACDCDALERRKVVLRRGRLLFQQPLIEEPKPGAAVRTACGPAALGWRRHHAIKDAHLSSLNALSDRMIWPTSQHTNGHWRQVFQGPNSAPVARKFWQYAAIRDTAIFRRAIGTPAVTVVSPDGLSYLTSAPRQPHRNCDRKTLWVPKCIDSSVQDSIGCF